MKLKYRDMVLRNCPNIENETLDQKLSLAGMGLSGEAGEVTDLLKKIIHHKKPLDVKKIIEEMGDVRWYLEYLAIVIGTTIEEVEAINMEKLLKRYPSGFNYKDANNRT